MLTTRVSLAVLIGLLLQPSTTFAQRKTIPAMLKEQGTDLTGGASVPSGAARDLDVILRDTDVIVRGVVGSPHSYLSDDEMTIFSDYPIVKPIVLFDNIVASSSKPGFPEIVVTLEGGKVTIGGLTFTLTPGALPGLQPGSDCFLLLKRVQDKLYVAGGGHYGAFEIGPDERLKPLTRKRDFAPAYRGAAAAAAINSIVGRRHALAR